MDTRAVSFSDYFRLLRNNRNFRLLWFAQIVSEQGDWMYTVAVYSLLLEFTGSAKYVAFAFVLQALPQFFVAPAAGVLNDRVSRKKVMICADWSRAVIVLSMLLVRSPQLVWLLYILLFLETVFWALFEPGRSAVIPNIASEQELVVANTLSSTTWSFNFAMGFAVGGVIAAYTGWGVFVLDSLSFVLSASLIRSMRFTEPHTENLPPLSWKDLAGFSPIREGIRYVWKDRRLRIIIFAKAGWGLIGANWVLLPIFGERVFAIKPAGFDKRQAGMLGMSLLMACRGAGAFAGPFLGGLWVGGRGKRMRWGILAGFFAGAIGYVVLGHAPNLAVACAGVILAHSGGAMVWVYSSTLLQRLTEDRYRGRVFSAELAFMVVMMSLSSYYAGTLIDGGAAVRSVATLTGLVVLIPAVLWGLALAAWKEPESAASGVA
ncbi:MAG TPA: MFS transporter [Bryobacteraceae bacterium]